MAGDALHTHGAVTDAKEARLAQAGLIAVQGPTVLDARTGVLHGIGSTALVTGTTTTGTMTVSVAPHVVVTSRGAANGPYLGPTLDAAQLVDIAAAPGSNSRIDVVWSKQQDATAGVPSPDGTTAPLISVTTGTAAASPTKPAIPVGAEELGTVTVAAGATNTLHANVTIGQTGKQTVARGAPIPVRTAAERDALTAYVGLSVKRLDDGAREERWTGTVWASTGDIPVFTTVANRNTFFTGNLRAGATALVAGNLHGYDGAAWRGSMKGINSGTTDANGLIVVPHGLGVTPTVILITPGAQASTLLNNIIDIHYSTVDADNFVAWVRRDDTNAVLPSNQVAFSWEVF